MTENTSDILFVCTGNTCRSPMAEYLYNDMVKGLSAPKGCSAGLLAADSDPATVYAIKAMRDFKLDLSPHRSRMLSRSMLAEASLVVTMTDSHKAELLRRFPAFSQKVVRLTEFSPALNPVDIPDPIGLSVGVYRTTRDAIDTALAHLIRHLKEIGVITAP